MSFHASSRKPMSRSLRARRWIGAAFTLVVSLCAVTAQAQPLIIGNVFALFGGGPIKTYDFTGGAVVGSFVPDGALNFNQGSGVLVLGNHIYYTELGRLGPT